MKRLLTAGTVALLLFSCAPVLNRELMREGRRNVSLDAIRANPDVHKGKLYVLGGLIVETRLMEQGSRLEVLSLSVDPYGYIEEDAPPAGRFLAVYPRGNPLLDPLVYKKGREVVLAGVFIDLKKGKIDEMEYVYPVFEIKQIYLFEEQPEYYNLYPYAYYSYPYWYNPYWGPWSPSPGWR